MGARSRYGNDEIIEELRTEQQKLTAAIAALETLRGGCGKRRGRPVGSKNKPKSTPRKKK
jgi:hypothetical protein